ncbi:restriction endonuclease subunit S [Ligilactobacillus murinus]|nr:restriction endonuclease subunit S [Ligilactobacillus murinus]
MAEEKKNIPKLRFREFTGDNANAWELRKFFDNIERVIDFRGRTPKKLGMEWSDEGYIVLSALNVKDSYIDFTADVHYANQDLYDKWMVGNELYEGQVLFTTEAPMGNVAQVPDNRKYVLSQRTIAFNIDKKKVTNDFLAILLRSQNVQLTLKSLASGGTAQGVSQKSLSQLRVIVPINIKEQQKIGSFFRHLDELITLHQRMLDEYKTLKKTMLSKIFPKNGEKYPELRFFGFTDAWEQRKLGEIVEWSKGSGLSKDALNIQGIGVPVIHYADLYKFNSVQKEVIHWTMNDIGTKIPENNLLFPMSDVTPDGLARTSTVLQSNVKAGGDVLIAKLNKDILSTFMSYQINRNKNQILPLVTGTTVRHINSKSLSTLKVTVPGKNEQKYVGSILMRFDSLIALHQRELELLKTLKKTMLQQMFV